MILGIVAHHTIHSIALINNDILLEELNFQSTYSSTENLHEHILTLCKKYSPSLDNIKAIGIVTGPGSYTGLRISISIAKTIAQTLNIPIYGITSLDAYLLPFIQNKGIYISMLSARKNEVSACLFRINDKIENISETIIWNYEQALKQCHSFEEPVTVVGEIPIDIHHALSQNKHINLMPRTLKAEQIAFFAQNQFKNNVEGNYNFIRPIYAYKAV